MNSLAMLKVGFVVVFCLVLGTTSAVVKIYQDEVTGHEGQCLGKNNKFYRLGEKIEDEVCVQKICKGTAAPGSVYIEVERCSNAKPHAECKLKSNAKTNYPDCCSKLECK